MSELYNDTMIKRLDGSVVKYDEDTLINYVYNDYTDLNIKLIDKYNLDLKIFYNELPEFNYIIEEIPMNNIKLVVDKMGIIIENSKESKIYMFDLKNIEKFIDICVDLILSIIDECR